jgi:hypothetical protein
VPDHERITELAEHLTGLGEEHAGVHFATIGWILPALHDPDGHEVRFYTTASHRDRPHDGQVRVIHDARESAQKREAEYAAAQQSAAER